MATSCSYCEAGFEGDDASDAKKTHEEAFHPQPRSKTAAKKTTKK
jgi:hypothetical protein